MGSLAAQQLCKPCLFRSGRLVWVFFLFFCWSVRSVCVGPTLPRRHRRGDSWVAAVRSAGTLRGRRPRQRLDAPAQLARQHLVRCSSSSSAARSLLVSLSLLFALFIHSLCVCLLTNAITPVLMPPPCPGFSLLPFCLFFGHFSRLDSSG